MFKSRHEIEPEDIPYEDIVKWCVGVDYGTANATAFLLCGKTADGTIYICKEYYFAGRLEAQAQNDFEAQKTDLEYAEDMKQFISDNYNLTGQVYRSGPNGMSIVTDPAASSFILQLRRMRMKVSRANNDVLDGIRTVATHIGDDRLFISKECVNTLKEIHTYVWDSKAQLQGVDRPVKVNDHCCLSGDTLINTIDGYKPISDLVGTEGVLYSLSDSGDICTKKYSNVTCTNDSAETLVLHFSDDSTVSMTYDHPLLSTNGWVVGSELSVGDSIITIDGGTLTISSIENGGKQAVYNLYVEDTHNFAITESNIVSHNCDALRYSVMKLRDKNKISGAAKNVGI